MSASFVRPDIREAETALERIKGVLVYKDEDELDTGMQKVQPLPFLDEEIIKFKNRIEEAVREKDQTDDIPDKVLSKVDHVICVATEGKTTLFKASELLEFSMNAFQYGRQLAKSRINLALASWRALEKFDKTFHQMMCARLSADMALATQCEEDCVEQLESALREAECDCCKWAEHSEEEASRVGSVGKLEELCVEVKESISDEVTELRMMRDQCSNDAHTIDSKMRDFKAQIERVTSDYRRAEEEKKRKLDKNLKEQKDLERRLAALKKEESQLTEELSAGQSQEDMASVAKTKARENVEEWKEKIGELRKRTETSLKVMDEMAEVTELILTDAQKKQREFNKNLAKIELDSLLSKRDVLMAQGSMYLLIEAESQVNIKNIESELMELEKDKKHAAKSNFKMKVDRIKQNIDDYCSEKENFIEKSRKARAKLDTIRKELSNVVDKRLKELQPKLVLDKIDARYTGRKALMDKVFSNESVEGIEFTSKYNYQ